MLLEKVDRFDGELAYYKLRVALNRYGKSPAELDSTQISDIHRQAITEYALELKILDSEAANKVHIPPHVVDSSMEELGARFENENDFLKQLDQNDLDKEGLRNALRRQLKVETVLECVTAQIKNISYEEAERYYNKNIEKFITPEIRTVRHILITINNDYADNNREAAKQRIEKIWNDIKIEKKCFADEAAKHSECPSALQGGLIGRVPRGRLYTELEVVLFQLQQGEISDIVDSPMGFHILYCEQIAPSETLLFSQVLPDIVEKLTFIKKQRYQEKWIKSLLQKT